MNPFPSYHLKLESTWLSMARALQPHVVVRAVVGDERARDRLDAQLRWFGIGPRNVELHVAPLDDIWARDNGPIFVVDDAGKPAVTTWNFNGWGGRFEHGRDAALAARLAAALDLPVLAAPLVTEGGALEVDGAGSFLATRSSILNPNRNPGMDRDDVERVLAEYLGVRHCIWLSGAPPDVCEKLGDTTDWHVDLAARFTPGGAVLYAATDDTHDPRHPWLARHCEELEKATDARGRPLDLVALPTPRVYSVSPSDSHPGGCGSPTDASYTNYLVSNGVVLVPVYGHAEDERARAILAEHFPGREVIGIPALTLTEEGGAVHCVTQQQPKAGP
jgi:agmatine deiminase